jgi:hypothetical protein
MKLMRNVRKQTNRTNHRYHGAVTATVFVLE